MNIRNVSLGSFLGFVMGSLFFFLAFNLAELTNDFVAMLFIVDFTLFALIVSIVKEEE